MYVPTRVNNSTVKMQFSIGETVSNCKINEKMKSNDVTHFSESCNDYKSGEGEVNSNFIPPPTGHVNATFVVMIIDLLRFLRFISADSDITQTMIDPWSR